jgi:hypothetical protein
LDKVTIGKYSVQRRVAGNHDFRLDGISDLLLRCRGHSVFDIGCNRGAVGLEFAANGATTIHGCDNYAAGINVARELFADIRSVQSQFEVVDLVHGPSALKVFGPRFYDFTLCLATYHKLKRLPHFKEKPEELSDLVKYFGKQTKAYFAWRATSDKPKENDEEIVALDRDLGSVGMVRIHTSYISDELGVAAIWRR